MWLRNCFLLILFFALPSGFLCAQEAYQELQAIIKAEVVEIESEREERIVGTDASTTVQTIQARIREGDKQGEIVLFENDLVLLGEGDEVFLNHVRTIDGTELYVLKDINRQGELFWLLFLFVILLISFAGWQGMRALFSLGLSVAAIVFVLVPALLNGFNPILASLGIASVVLALVLFGTHGFNARSLTAFLGTFSAVLVTSWVALVFVGAMRLSGFGSDASVYLNFATGGQLDFSALLLGSIIIGILGVLDDVSITQASVVQELKAANQNFNAWELYNRAIRVGRDHVGSLVNTLALAYVGAALPLVLLFSTSEAPLGFSLNQEIIASEIARIIVGSIGLILAVPLTTAVAAWWFAKRGVDEQDISAHSHGHSH